MVESDMADKAAITALLHATFVRDADCREVRRAALHRIELAPTRGGGASTRHRAKARQTTNA
ncbi:hypothetical protein GCM10010869_34360 [Mesorhizobium tianshanense]|nr:hypothetical protein GCM10010869_34360 [Mesorhizobium tianshanense]